MEEKIMQENNNIKTFRCTSGVPPKLARISAIFAPPCSFFLIFDLIFFICWLIDFSKNPGLISLELRIIIGIVLIVLFVLLTIITLFVICCDDYQLTIKEKYVSILYVYTGGYITYPISECKAR